MSNISLEVNGVKINHKSDVHQTPSQKSSYIKIKSRQKYDKYVYSSSQEDQSINLSELHLYLTNKAKHESRVISNSCSPNKVEHELISS